MARVEAGKLIYAIIDGEGERNFSFSGLDGAPLETFSYRDLAAVASPIDPQRFKQGDEGRLQADTLRYQQVNLHLLEHQTVVPMRFGFIARDEKHVREVLEKIYLQLRTLLNRLKGKVELVVQSFWDLPKVLQEVAAQDEGILEAKREAYHVPESALGSRLSVEIGRLLFGAAEARKKDFISAIHGQIFPLALDFSEGPRRDESMIFNRSYLVEKGKEGLFDQAVARLGDEYEGYLKFRYIGPLPAYSFVNIELSQGNFVVVDRARKLLNLPERASVEMIRTAYRRLALASHPDRHPDSPRAGDRFRDVAHAYEVLEAYCQSFGLGGEKPPQYSFAQEDVEKVFIVKEKQPESW